MSIQQLDASVIPNQKNFNSLLIQTDDHEKKGENFEKEGEEIDPEQLMIH